MTARTPPDCTVTGCHQPRDAQGYCRLHYQRWQITGDPNVTPGQAIEEAVVGRVVAGQPPGRRLTVAEREAAVSRLYWARATETEIAARVGLAGRSSVYAIKKRLGLTRPRGGPDQ
ncbi:hypothetical protein ACFYQA_17385 [Streptomyces sp. NPDC005774]|uniref:hypothetical protein n=1 Tax=Streptomyces sp. NPDC005774 TaxID=3364728 RepID=UPI0036B34288